MTDLSPSLATIEHALRRLGRRVLLESLQEGVPAEVVRSSLAAADLQSSSQLETLYGWKNGTSTDGVAAVDDIHLFPGFYLLSLEDALANYREFVTHDRWTIGWLPLFANGGGDFYFIDLSQPTAGTVGHFRIEESEHPSEFGSLQALMATLATAFERGVFFVDPSGYLEMDDLVFAGVAAEFNPDIAWWRD